jgi:hypothetical protein
MSDPKEPTILVSPPAVAGAQTAVPTAIVASGATAGGPSPDTAELRAEMIADRFDAAAARAGIDESYTDVALELFRKSGKEPTKANLAAFCGELKKTRPALFGPQPAQTAPMPAHAAPATPAPGAITSRYQQWQALRAAGRNAEAEAFYLIHHGAITRSA